MFLSLEIMLETVSILAAIRRAEQVRYRIHSMILGSGVGNQFCRSLRPRFDDRELWINQAFRLSI